jgi:hypothetical protein
MCALVRVGGRALIEPDADQVKVLALSFFGELYFLSRCPEPISTVASATVTNAPSTPLKIPIDIWRL